MTIFYSIELKLGAIKDLQRLDKKEALRITQKIKALENNLSGNVKK